MKKVICIVTQRFRSRKGQGMVEYGLILGFVALCVIIALGAIPEPITNILNTVTHALGLTP